MLSETEFEHLINSPESSILDFKYEFYNFESAPLYNETAKFVKDVASFSNTIRRETAFIIIGVEVNQDGSKILHGIKRIVDDAILQDKVKDKLFPRPIFKSFTIRYNNLVFGVIGFPVTKYEIPVVPTIKLRGLEIGKVYYRRGSSNNEAMSLEVIKISDWLRGLPGLLDSLSLTREISTLLKRLTSGDEKLSAIFADMLQLGKIQNLHDLKSFCSEELLGVKSLGNFSEAERSYRIREVMISPHKISINPNYHGKINPSMIKQEMEKDKSGFHLNRFMFNQSISQIEGFLSRTGGIPYFENDANDLFDDMEKGGIIYSYVFRETWESVYSAIRQRAIEELMKI